MRGDGCRKVRAAVEPGAGELVVGGISGSSVERFIDHFVVTAEFLLQNIRPTAIRSIPFTGTALIGYEAPRKRIAEDHNSDRLCKTGADERQYGNQTEEFFHLSTRVDERVSTLLGVRMALVNLAMQARKPHFCGIDRTSRSAGSLHAHLDVTLDLNSDVARTRSDEICVCCHICFSPQ
jgi:hypothetical protein